MEPLDGVFFKRENVFFSHIMSAHLAPIALAAILMYLMLLRLAPSTGPSGDRSPCPYVGRGLWGMIKYYGRRTAYIFFCSKTTWSFDLLISLSVLSFYSGCIRRRVSTAVVCAVCRPYCYEATVYRETVASEPASQNKPVACV